jgi:hypothetical protein
LRYRLITGMNAPAMKYCRNIMTERRILRERVTEGEK